MYVCNVSLLLVRLCFTQRGNVRTRKISLLVYRGCKRIIYIYKKYIRKYNGSLKKEN